MAMYLQAFTAVALLTQTTVAAGNFFSFGCSQLVIQRVDPLVDPGMSPSPHTHQIVGGNSFNITMDPSNHDPPTLSTCTTCTKSEDFSNYWTASLYFKSPENGSYKRVPQAGGFFGEKGHKGGHTVYYMEPFGGSQMKTTAFKPGFRMLAGNPALRSTVGTNSGICHRRYGNGEGFAPCDSKDTTELPKKMCPGGIRASIIFPTCWDGKNLDSPDHKSHMAYSPSGVGLADDKCPATHPIRMPQVMYEVYWDTKQFNNPTYFQNGKQPLVYSFGDATGYGQHGDYLFGWKGDALQRGMDAMSGFCGSKGCAPMKEQSIDAANSCTIGQQYVEDVGLNGGWLKQLPGGMPVTTA